MSRKKLNLRSLINEKNIRYKMISGELPEEFETDELENFQKIKHKPKHSNSEIGEFQLRKKKLNHTKRGKK